MSEKFDVTGWKNQAQTALETLLAKRADTLLQLDTQDKEIDELSAALGLQKTTEGTRRRLRGPILAFLETLNAPVSIQVLAESLDVEGATEDQITKAVRRTVRDCENVAYADEENNSVVFQKAV